MADDLIVSGQFYPLNFPGYHSVMYQETPSELSLNESYLVPTYNVIGQSFYLINPKNVSNKDEIPPSRITDFQLVDIQEVDQIAIFQFSEPGDDFMYYGGMCVSCNRKRLLFSVTSY